MREMSSQSRAIVDVLNAPARFKVLRIPLTILGRKCGSPSSESLTAALGRINAGWEKHHGHFLLGELVFKISNLPSFLIGLARKKFHTRLE